MSRRLPERWPISSRRVVKSGISTRPLRRRRTRSALSASRRTGPAMVPASSTESSTCTPAAIRNTLRIDSRSAATVSSISAPCVDSSSAPRTVRKRWIGTATSTMTSPRSLMRTMLAFWPLSDLRDLRIALAVVAAEVVIGRQVAAPEPGAHGDEGALDDAGLLGVGRRQVEAQHVAAAIEAAAVEDQRAVAVVDARPRLGRRDQPPQQRRDALGIDREFVAEQRVVARAVALAGLQLQEPVGIDADGVGLDRRRRGDGAGDDLALDDAGSAPARRSGRRGTG